MYVTVDGCLSLRNHLAVRAVLRDDPVRRDEYGRLKLALAERDYVDVDGYVADKSELLQALLAEGGLDSAERAAIDRINRPG